MPKHNRGGPGQLRSHSRSSSATRLGANLQFTQPGAAAANQVPQKVVRRASGYEQTNATRVAPPLTRVHSGQRVQSREQIAKRLAPLQTQQPPSRQSKNDATTKKAYEAQREAVEDAGDEDDDDEWESSVEGATPDQEGSGSETASEDEMDQAILKNLNLGQQPHQGPTRATQEDFDQQLLQQQQLREYERQKQQAMIEQEQYLLQRQYEQLQRQQLAQQEQQRMLPMQHRQQQQQGAGGQRQYEEQLALQQQYEQRYLAQQQEHQRMIQQQQLQQQRGGGGQMRYEDQQALQQQYEQRKYLEQQHLQRLHQQQLQQQQQYQQQQQQQKQQVRQPQPIRQLDFVVPNEAEHVQRTNSAQRVNQERAPVKEIVSTPRATTPRQPSQQSTQRAEQQRSSQSQRQSNRHPQQYLQVYPEDPDIEDPPARNTSTPPTPPQNHPQFDTVPPTPTSPTTGAKPTTNSQRSPRPGHPRSRPPSMHSINSSRTDHVRPHPLFRGLSHGAPRTAPLAPLTVVPTSANTEIPMSRSPEGSVSSARQFLSSSPTSQRTASGGSPASVVVSVADLTHPFASQSTNGSNAYGKNGGRRTSVSGASMRSAATTATGSVLPLPPHLVSVHAGILAGPHERARTMSAINGGSSGSGGMGGSSAALSSLTNLPTTTRPPSPQAIAFFPPTNPHANLDAIHPLLPPPYLVNHLTILSRRTPLRESFDRVIRAKNAAR